VGMLHLGSSNIVDLGGNELGLPGHPRASLLPASWRQVEGGVELMCSHVVVVGQLLKETLATIGRDVLQLVWVSPKMERKIFT
jgi:hypothetical protein